VRSVVVFILVELLSETLGTHAHEFTPEEYGRHAALASTRLTVESSPAAHPRSAMNVVRSLTSFQSA